MLTLRKSDHRGKSKFSWLDSFHSFSFGQYYDPQHMGYSHLRVINDDYVKGGAGFGKHPHRDMEILTYVLEGALEHEDSLGNTSVLKAGEFQRMSAGKGIFHSEYNHSKTEPVHFLQIWIEPEQVGLEPSYEQKEVRNQGEKSTWQLIASREGGEETMVIHQDAKVYLANIEEGHSLAYSPDNNRKVWGHLISGQVMANGQALQPGDGLALEGEALQLEVTEEAEFILFDLSGEKS